MADLSEVKNDMQRGIVARLRTLLLVLDRQDRLETGEAFTGWLEAEANSRRISDHAREMLLRAMRVASDPVNYAVLAGLDLMEPVAILELMESTGLSRVAVSERVNDMVQTGLAIREMVNDEVRGTDLTRGICSFIESAADAAGDELATELADLATTGSR
ncbi:MAG: hypothetical protein HKN91_00665 [Acidimicrobiia bacterium]|nr:hypothetical protein [Acidimicrobiia bacterium]